MVVPFAAGGGSDVVARVLSRYLSENLKAPFIVDNRAGAGGNIGTRYAAQAKPDGDKSCSNCVQFVPGKNPKGPGECKAIAGDTEISPQGYCIAWVKK